MPGHARGVRLRAYRNGSTTLQQFAVLGIQWMASAWAPHSITQLLTFAHLRHLRRPHHLRRPQFRHRQRSHLARTMTGIGRTLTATAAPNTRAPAPSTICPHSLLYEHRALACRRPLLSIPPSLPWRPSKRQCLHTREQDHFVLWAIRLAGAGGQSYWPAPELLHGVLRLRRDE